MTEYLLSEILSKHNISPSILLSNDKQPYIINKNEVYNLQEYIENDRVNNSEINFYHLGKVISLFHSKSKKISGIYEQEDRFALKIMSKKMIEMQEWHHFEFKNELLHVVNQCLDFRHTENCYIHGDLGAWNLLFNYENIYIIDFGEVRRGNNHFDISAVISSTLEWEQGDTTLVASLCDFQKGYLLNNDKFNWKDLKENLSLWFVRGIVATIINHGINERTSNYTKQILERKNGLDKIIDTHFLL